MNLRSFLITALFSIALISSYTIAEVKNITTKDEFQKLVISASQTKPVIVDFYATWCPPCKRLLPVFDKVSKQFSEKITFIKVDSDQATALTSSQNIKSLPTLLFVNKGNITRETGFKTEKQLKDLIKKNFNIN